MLMTFSYHFGEQYPSRPDRFGFRGPWRICSKRTVSFLWHAEIMSASSSASGGKNSNITSWTWTGANPKASSSWISWKPSSVKSLCRNLETRTCAAKVCFTSLAVLPSKTSCSRVVSISPDARKRTSIARTQVAPTLLASICTTAKTHVFVMQYCLWTFWKLEAMKFKIHQFDPITWRTCEGNAGLQENVFQQSWQ